MWTSYTEFDAYWELLQWRIPKRSIGSLPTENLHFAFERVLTLMGGPPRNMTMNQTELQWDDAEAPKPVGYLRIAPSSFGQRVFDDTLYWLSGMKDLYDPRDGLLLFSAMPCGVSR